MSVEKKINYDVQGGIRNYLGKQKTISNVPLKWKSGPGHPKTELAYITKEEKDLLIKKDLHNSLKNGPNKGPGGIMSLNNDGIGDTGGPGSGGSENAGTGGNDGFGGGGGGGGGGTGSYVEAPPGDNIKPGSNDPNYSDGNANTGTVTGSINENTNEGSDEPPTPPNFSIHTGPTYKAPPRVPDQIGFSTFGNVPGVKYNAVGPGSQFALNTQLKNQLLDATYQPPNLPFFIPGSTLIKTLGSFGFNKNKDFFTENVAGKYGYGYGLKDFEKYMGDRASGKVGAYGNENMGQNKINERSGGDDGIMTVYNNPNDTDDGDGDADGDGDVDQTDNFIFRYFDKSGKSLQAGAGGVEDLMRRIRQRLDNIFTT